MLRTATPNDLDALLAIENTMFDPAVYDRLCEQNFARLLNKSSSVLYVWEEDGSVVGYALGIVVARKHIWFNSLAVLKAWQSTEAAKRLFAAIEVYALTRPLETIILEIREDNRALLRRYTRMGYCEWKRIPGYYPDGSSAIRMLKKIQTQ
ncbi:MAG: GNAT family N-acetyltransferase [Campylobacterales bacterium]|nr:GNAT family N-acetyltransferase [Campylobacterales bacterium]